MILINGKMRFPENISLRGREPMVNLLFAVGKAYLFSTLALSAVLGIVVARDWVSGR